MGQIVVAHRASLGVGGGSRLLMPWEGSYRTLVLAADLILILVTLRVSLFFTNGHLTFGPRAPGALAAIVGVVLVLALVWSRAWDHRILGQGAEEFRRVGAAVFSAIIVIALTALAADIGNLRVYVFWILPSVGVVLIVGRYALRRGLHAHRRRGRCMLPVIAAGSFGEVEDLVRRTRQETHNGWRIAGVCIPKDPSDDGTPEPRDIEGVPVVGSLDDVAAVVNRGHFRVVAVAPDTYWTRRRLQELAWEIEDSAAELVVAPGLMEVTGPRLHVAPVYGLTLLRVSQPSFTGGKYILKAALDRVLAVGGILVLAPILLLIALAIKLDDGGPVFYRQYRVGRAGIEFPIIKFRSMVVTADRDTVHLAQLNEGAGPLFKLHRDPRVTSIGGLLRRYSLDELPQLFNVLFGQMSVVGPRPPLPEEVSKYAPDARRRLLVKPGLTGLWQVSGRSDLSWDESVRLDLRYVENWSLALDAVIIWKTIGAVWGGRGAY